MYTKIIWPWDLPDSLDGIAVVCDVWGATTNINTLLAKGVNKLLVVNVDNIQSVKEKYKDALVIGESLKLPKSFFDTSNYPFDVANVDAKDRTILYMSNNGSRVIELAFAKKALKILTVSFSNLKSVYEYLKDANENIYLIPSGDSGTPDPKVKEDLICVESLEKLIKGEDVDIDRAKELAISYIKTVYGDQDFDQQQNFKYVIESSNLSIVPICKKEKEGWISIRDASRDEEE